MNIRQERKSEYDYIYQLVKTAFQTAQVSGGKEQDFVLQLRSGAGYIPELALVAEENGQLIGHIMLTKFAVNQDSGNFNALLLAPISVALEWRSKGIGSQLIEESFKIAKHKGYTAVFLVGNPAYYERFGFRSTKEFNILNANGIPDEYVLVCELVPNALEGTTGTINLL